MKSVTLLQFTSNQREGGSLEEVAHDHQANWMTALEPLAAEGAFLGQNPI